MVGRLFAVAGIDHMGVAQAGAFILTPEDASSKLCLHGVSPGWPALSGFLRRRGSSFVAFRSQ
jgi:hypothetical protein